MNPVDLEGWYRDAQPDTVTRRRCGRVLTGDYYRGREKGMLAWPHITARDRPSLPRPEGTGFGGPSHLSGPRFNRTSDMNALGELPAYRFGIFETCARQRGEHYLLRFLFFLQVPPHLPSPPPAGSSCGLSSFWGGACTDSNSPKRLRRDAS